MARTRQIHRRGYNPATRATSVVPPLPHHIVQQIADIALAHTCLPSATTTHDDGHGGNDKDSSAGVGADVRITMDEASSISLRDYMEATIHRQLDHCVAIAEHCRFSTVMGAFTLTDPVITSYWRDNGPRWLRGRHVTSNAILGRDNESSGTACCGGALCPRRYDPDHIMIDSVWSWLLSIGMGRYASQLYAGARNWSYTSANTLINNLSAPVEHKQMLQYHLSRLQQFIAPLIVSHNRTDDASSASLSKHGSDGNGATKVSRMSYGRARYGMTDAQRADEAKSAHDRSARITATLGDLSSHPIFGVEKAAEDRFRQLFQQSPHDSELMNPWCHCIDLYSISSSDTRTKVSASVPKNDDNAPFSVLETHGRWRYNMMGVSAGSDSWVKLSEFQINWENLSHNRLFQPLSTPVSGVSSEMVDWKHIVVAGGAIMACLLPNFTLNDAIGTNGFANSDIDIFFWGLTPEQCSRNLIALLYHINTAMGTNAAGDILISPHSITILGIHPYRHIQIVLRCYQSPAQVLMGFDIDSCCVAFDGNRVYALPRAIRAMHYRLNCVDLSRRSLTYEHRLLKYAQRGFNIGVAGLDLSLVDDERLHRAPHAYTGLSRLLASRRMHVVTHQALVQHAWTTQNLEADPARTDSKSHGGGRASLRYGAPLTASGKLFRETQREFKSGRFNGYVPTASPSSSSSSSSSLLGRVGSFVAGMVTASISAITGGSSSSNDKKKRGADTTIDESPAPITAAVRATPAPTSTAPTPTIATQSASDNGKKRRTIDNDDNGGDGGVAAMNTSVDSSLTSGTSGTTASMSSTMDAGHMPSVAEQAVNGREAMELDHQWPRGGDKRDQVLVGDESDYGWVPAFGLVTPQSLQSLWNHGRTLYRLRDGGVVRLCKIHQLSRTCSTTSNHHYTGVLAMDDGDEKHDGTVDGGDGDVIDDLTAAMIHQQRIERWKSEKGSVSLHWLSHDPGRQLLSGSFHPLDDDQWDQRHEWHKGYDGVDKSGRTFTSIFTLINQRYGAMAAIGLEHALPSYIPTVVATLMASYLLSSEMTDLLQWCPLPPCDATTLAMTAATTTTATAADCLPSDWNGVTRTSQLLTGAVSLPHYGAPHTHPLPLATVGRPLLSANDRQSSRYRPSPSVPTPQLAFDRFTPMTNDAARMLQSILSFMIHDITQASIFMGQRARRRGLSSREIQSTIRVLFHASLARYMVSEGVKTATMVGSLRWHYGTDRAQYTEINTNIIAYVMRTYMTESKLRHISRLWPSAPTYLAGVINYLIDILCQPLLCLTCDGEPRGICPACGRAPVTPPPPVIPPLPSQFTCGACTFINHTRANTSQQTCSMCNTPYTPPPPSAVVPPVPVEASTQPIAGPPSMISAFDIWRNFTSVPALMVYASQRGLLLPQPLPRASFIEYASMRLAMPLPSSPSRQLYRLLSSHMVYPVLAAQQTHAVSLRHLAALPTSTPSRRPLLASAVTATPPSSSTSSSSSSTSHVPVNYAVTLQRAAYRVISSVLTTQASIQGEFAHHHRHATGVTTELQADGSIVTKPRPTVVQPLVHTCVCIEPIMAAPESSISGSGAEHTLNTTVDALIMDFLPGVLRLATAGNALTTSTKGNGVTITSGTVLSALSLRHDHPWNGSQLMGFTPLSGAFSDRMNEHEQLIALANRLWYSPSSSASKTAVTRDVVHTMSIPTVQSYLMDHLPSLQSCVQRISGTAIQWQWQPSAIQAFQMIIELALLPIVSTAIVLSCHRNGISLTITDTSASVTSSPVSVSPLSPSVRVVITRDDINMAIRLRWTHRLPPLLRQCDTSIRLDGMNGLGQVDEPASLADRYRDVYDTQALHGVKTPPWVYRDSIYKDKIGRESPTIHHDIASYMGWTTRQRLQIPYNVMHQKISSIGEEFKHSLTYEASFIPGISMMAEARVQQMATIAAACALHRLTNTDATTASSSSSSSLRSRHIIKADVDVAIAICDSLAELPVTVAVGGGGAR